MEIQKKNDHSLLAELKGLVAQEKNIHVKVIAYLREVDRRELHVARGFSSLFAFCTEYLGYTEAESHVRIQAMRLSREIPEISQKIETGELSLTAVAQAQTVFRRQKVDLGRKEAILKNLENKSTRAVDRTLAILFPSEPKHEKTKAVSEEFTRVEFNANRRLMKKLEKLKELLAHKNFSGRYDLLFEHLADEALRKFEKKGALAAGEAASELNPPSPAPAHIPSGPATPPALPSIRPSPSNETNSASLRAPQATKPGRYIPAKVKKLLWRARPAGCAYIDPINGRRCGSKHGLQIDHIEEFAKGGGHGPDNLQLLCRAHNQFKSRAHTNFFRPWRGS